MLDFLKGVDIENTDKATVDLLKSMSEAVEARIEEYLKGVIDKDAMEKSINEALKSIDSRQELASVKEQITEVKESLVRMKGAFECKDGKVQVKSIEAQIEEQLKEYITLEKGKKIVNLKSACQNGNGKKFTMNLVVEKADTLPTSFETSHLSLGAYTDTSMQNPRQESILRRYANVAPANGRAVLYAEVQYGDEQAEWVEEGLLKPLMTGGVVQKSVLAGKVALATKLTEETLTDFPQLVAEVKAEIINRIGLAEEKAILFGDEEGTIDGITIDVPGFSLTSLDVEKPNIYDAIVAGYTQIVSTSGMSYRPNLVLVNPLDYAAMQLTKDVNGQYLRPFKSGDELIQGLEVVATTSIEQGNLVMGDFNYLNIRDVVELTVEFGWENDDFRKNLVTMIGEKRLVPYVKSQYKTAFLRDTIANIIAGITKA